MNGLLITHGRLPPFIATLGMMSVARGAALVFTEGRPVSGFEAGFRSLATARVLGIPAPVLGAAVVYLLAHLLLARTRFGRYVYAIGGNEEATRLSGVAVRFHKTMVYVLCGVTSAIAAVLLTARLNSAQPIAGMMYELDAIAATVIGGTSLLGGSGGRAHHGRAAQRVEPARRLVVPAADRDRRRHHRGRSRGLDAQATGEMRS